MYTYYLLLTVYYSLLTTHYLLLAAYCLLLTTYYLLLTAYYLLLTTHCLLLTTYCLLLTLHSLLLTTYYLLPGRTSREGRKAPPCFCMQTPLSHIRQSAPLFSVRGVELLESYSKVTRKLLVFCRGVEFSTFFSHKHGCTPPHLLNAGIYASIAGEDTFATTSYYYLLLTTYYLLLTTYYLLLTTYCLLLTTYYSLLTTYYLLLTTYYSLLTTDY